MAFQTIRPMFGTGTFYTPESNFFVDYMYTRIALTNKKNQELAKLEIDAQNRKERGLKDEEVRLRNNITRLQQSLLNREQAYISRTFKKDQKTSAQRTGDDVRGRREQAAERRRIDTQWNQTIDKEQKEYASAQNRLRAAESDIGNHAVNLSTDLRRNSDTDPNFWDINNGRGQKAMVEAYRKNQKAGQRGGNAPSPIDIARGGSVFILMYKQVLEDFGPEAAESFQHAVVAVGYPQIDEKYRTQAVLGGVGSGSWEEEFRLYGSDQNVARIQQMNEDRREEKAEVPDYGAGSGSSSSRTSTGGGAAAPLAETETTKRTERMIEEYEARLKDVMGQREGAEGARADIIERRLGRKGLAGTLTPFEYVDEDVQSILDEVLGIEDEDVRRQTLEEGRMLVSGPRGKIANEFVENQVLNEEAIRGHFDESYTRWLQSREEMAEADAALVRLRAELNEIRGASDDPEHLESVSVQIEALVANINRQERRKREAREQHDLYGKIHDQLKPLVGSERGVAAEWSAMGPRERLLILQGINAGAVAKASNLGNRISTTREEIQLLEDQVRDIESDVGPRPAPRRGRGEVEPGGLGREGSRLGTGLEAPTNFEKNDAAMAALQELEGDKQALQALLVEQNQHLTFSGEATGAIDFLVENDPAYRIEPPASRGLGTEAPASVDVFTEDQEEDQAKVFGDIGKRKGEEEGIEGVEEAGQLMSDASLRDLNVEEAKKKLEGLLEVPEPTDSQQQIIRDLERFLASKEAQLEARPESEDVAEAGDRVTVPEEELEEPDYTYELQTPGSVKERGVAIEGLTSDLPSVEAQEDLKLGKSMEELAKQVYGDDTFDVAPSPEPEEDELDFEFESVIDLIEESEGDFKPGGFEFGPIDESQIEVEDEQAKKPKKPKKPKTPTPPLDYNPELREQLEVEFKPTDLSKIQVEGTPATTNQKIIDAVRGFGGTQPGEAIGDAPAPPDPRSLLRLLKKGFQQSEELLDAVREVTHNQEFSKELKKLSKEEQAQWAGIWDSMSEAHMQRTTRRHEAERKMTEGDILEGSMPLGR